MKNQVFLLAFTFMLAGGQVLFKKLGLAVRGMPPAEALLTVLRDPVLYAALAFYGVATLLWIWILSRVPLSQAYPWVAVGMVVVPLLGWYLFGERIAPMFWIGTALIIAGLALIHYGNSSV
ncbi:MAG TPA: SMR family transporter [Stellaceae bacterium]|jgi:multidrug transporter EmrE-like cation transporter